MDEPRDTSSSGPKPGELPENLVGWCELKPDGTYALRLDTPVQHGDRTVTEITGRRPRGKHMRKMPLDKMEIGHWLEMFQQSSGTATVITDQLDSADVMRVVTLMGFFMGGGLQTGPTSSVP